MIQVPGLAKEKTAATEATQTATPTSTFALHTTIDIQVPQRQKGDSKSELAARMENIESEEEEAIGNDHDGSQQ